jgi:hypothetical protein
MSVQTKFRAIANVAGGQSVHEEPKGICEIPSRRPETHIIQKGGEIVEDKVRSNAE